MPQWMKLLAYRQEEGNSQFQHPHKDLTRAWEAGLSKQRGIPGTSWPAKLVNLRVRKDPVSSKEGGGNTVSSSGLCTHIHVCVHAYVCEPTHTDFILKFRDHFGEVSMCRRRLGGEILQPVTHF